MATADRQKQLTLHQEELTLVNNPDNKPQLYTQDEEMCSDYIPIKRKSSAWSFLAARTKVALDGIKTNAIPAVILQLLYVSY